MTRKDILEAASKAVHAQDMDHDYGRPEDNFTTIAELWNTYLDALDCDCLELEARDVAAMMILLKIARVATSKKKDNWGDIAGYAACGGEIDCDYLVSDDEQVTLYADNLEIYNLSLNPVATETEIKFTAKKEDER